MGFVGAQVFCLQHNSVSTIEISQSATIARYMDENRYDDAYSAACLKASEEDWKDLAFRALEALELEVAKKALSRLNQYLYLELIKSYEASGDKSKHNQLTFLGDISAMKGNYQQAVVYYRQAGKDDKAVKMYTDLKMFDQAQELIRSGDTNFKKQLAMKKAEWIKTINEPKAAAEMYLTAGEFKEAIDIIGQHGWTDMLMTVVHQLDKGDKNNLTKCAEYLMKHKQFYNAIEVYKKAGDSKSLTLVYVACGQWDDAFALVNQFPELKQEVYSKYATQLAQEEKFTEAQAAFHAAGMTREALDVLQTLTANAINENRFSDAGYYTWVLSHQCLDLLAEEKKKIQRLTDLTEQQEEISRKKQQHFLDKYQKLQSVADIYFAYERIYKFIVS